MSGGSETRIQDGIAIIGMSGRFPGAASVDELWCNLRDGVESVTFFSDRELEAAGVAQSLLRNPDYVKAKAVLDNVEGFDAWFFRFAPREAEITDPQHRLFLECAWEALENAGCDPERYADLIGVYAGAGINTYLLHNLSSNRDLLDSMSAFQTSIHNKNDHLTTRVAYLLNLRGPSVTVQTACSTSLVAVCLACQSLLNYQCDMALAGGVTITLPQKSGYLYQEGGIGSPDGHCRAFDAKAAGTLDGNGAGIVVLKRLEDALADGDTIHAVIRGAAINNDGSNKIGYTAPGLDAQAEVIATAQAMAGFAAESISYVEAHGTATPLGDPIEIAALTKAFRLSTDKKGFCAIGSVKTNIGHLDAAAGVAGLIKTVLSLKHRMLPPSLHFEQPNSRIDFANSPFYVNAQLSEWEKGATPRRAGVSSFGIGGTNAHVVLEEAPEVPSNEAARPWQLLLLSTKTSTALETASDNLAEFLEKKASVNLADVAYTLQVGRGVFNHRRVVLCHDAEDAARALRTLDYERIASRFQEAVHRPVTFMFPGQGTQYVSMAAEVYEAEPLFRRQVDACAELLKPHLEVDLRALLYPSEIHRADAAARLDQTAFTQPALFVIEYALAKLWMDWGVHPTAMVGHSIGEYVAACLAGVFSLEAALALVAIRGQLIQSLPPGSMLAVTMPEREVLPLLDEQLSLAAVNGPSSCVVSGSTDAVEALEKRLIAQGVLCRRLQTSHAFHSKKMEPICEAFTERVSQIRLRPPQVPYISNVTGTWITATQAIDVNYWTQHLRQTVRFGDGISELLKEPERVLLEVGPGRALKTAARWHPDKAPTQVVETSLPYRDERRSALGYLLSTLGKLWLAGVEIDWRRFSAHELRRRVALPTYPFERKRYWVDARRGPDATQPPAVGLRKKTDITGWFYVPTWKESITAYYDTALLAGRKMRWLVFANNDGFNERLVRRLEELGQDVRTVSSGTEFSQTGERSYRINAAHRQDYTALLEALQAGAGLPDAIVHLWSVTAEEDSDSLISERLQAHGFYSLLSLAQAIGEKVSAPLQLTVISNAVQDVTGEETLCPEKATVLGACKVIPREYPKVACRSLDITLPAAESWQEERLVNQIIAESVAGGTNPVVAYRNGRCWVQDFEQVPLTDGRDQIPLLREGGVYLITGGLGGMGLTLAEYLAANARAKLVLCGRSSFPSHERWDEWLATHDEKDRTSKKIQKLRQLEAAGAAILVARADVTDEDDMRGLVALTLARFGQLNGVVHAAGIAGGGLIQLRKREDAARVFAPKLKGAQILETICEGLRLDFLVLCSSLSSVVGRPGQVDYCAANAFLDAFARSHHRRHGTFTVAINWGQWQQLGMAEGDAFAWRAESEELQRLDYPLLEKRLVSVSGEEIYITEFNVNKHWVLDEHRLVGNAVIPGVAYFEMVREALAERARGKVIELHDVYFVGPLRVRDDQTREVRLILQSDAEGFSFTVESESMDEEAEDRSVRTYALGKVRLTEPSPVRQYDVDKLIAGCNVSEEIFADEQREDDLGPRWQNVKQAHIGVGEVVMVLELSESFSADVQTMKYHPALMDRAVGRAKEYLVADEYLPVSYKLVRINAAIPGKIYSYARQRETDDTLKETLTWDTVVLDEKGCVLVEIEGFVQKRINDAANTIKAYAGRNEGGAPTRRAATARPFLDERSAEESGGRTAVREEMQPPEGVEAFKRILAHRIGPQVVVSVRDLRATIEQADVVTQESIRQEADKPLAPRAVHPRPSLRTNYVEPGNELEHKITATWQELLGIEQVGIHDNFFELGGDSVQAILIIASLNKAGLQLTPQQFFQYQTISELSEMIAATASASSEAAVTSEQSVGVSTRHSLPVEEPAADLPSDFPLADLDEEQLSRLSLLLAEADGEVSGAQSMARRVGEGGPAPAAVRVADGFTHGAQVGARDRATERIEAVLRQHPAVSNVVVMAQGDVSDDERGNDKGLVAFVVLDGKEQGYRPTRPMQFSLFYFADDNPGSSRDKYRLYLDGARFADRHNFAAVWTPERHFHSSGGLYPNPSVLSAGLATATENVRLCAGSVVLPLHHALRVAEEWSVVDNLSDGRVGVSFTSGWIPNDFAFFPTRFADRREQMFDGIEQVRRLWRGESMRVKDGAGNETEVRIFPQPVQPELPVWLTCSGDPQMFVRAGELGVSVLTALLTQSVEETASKIALYREAFARSGHNPESVHVTLMVHTFVGDDAERVLAKVRAPLRNYLKSHVGLMETMVKSLNLQADPGREEYLDDLVSFAFERYYQTASLIGTPDKCLPLIERLQTIGVNEVACFIDFGVDAEAVIGSLPQLNALKQLAEVTHARRDHDRSPDLISRVLGDHVRQNLSDEMVPSNFQMLSALPLNADGTIDRRTLALQNVLHLEQPKSV